MGGTRTLDALSISTRRVKGVRVSPRERERERARERERERERERGRERGRERTREIEGERDSNAPPPPSPPLAYAARDGIAGCSTLVVGFCATTHNPRVSPGAAETISALSDAGWLRVIAPTRDTKYAADVRTYIYRYIDLSISIYTYVYIFVWGGNHLDAVRRGMAKGDRAHTRHEVRRGCAYLYI